MDPKKHAFADLKAHDAFKSLKEWGVLILSENWATLSPLTCPLPTVPSRSSEVRQFVENDGHETKPIHRRADHRVS